MWTLKDKNIVDPYARGVVEAVFCNDDYVEDELGPNLSPTSVSLANALTIGDFAFSYCQIMTSISLPSVETVGIRSFEACTGLTTISLPSATTIDSGAFKGCTGATSISLPSATTIGGTAFDGCTSLVALDVSSISSTNVLKKLKSWRIPVGCEVTCSNNETITITQEDYESNSGPLPCFTYDENQFITGVSENPEVNINDNGHWILGENYRDIVDEYALGVADMSENCQTLSSQPLTSIYLPNATYIGSSAFQTCTGLQEFIIPENVTFIGVDAFYGATNLTDIYCHPNPANLEWHDGWRDDFKESGATTCHVKAEYVSAYEAKFHTYPDGWSGDSSLDPYVNVTFVGDLVVPVPPVPGTSPLPQFKYNSSYQISGLTEDSDINDSGSIDVGPSESATVWALKSANKAVYDEYARGIANVEYG